MTTGPHDPYQRDDQPTTWYPSGPRQPGHPPAAWPGYPADPRQPGHPPAYPPGQPPTAAYPPAYPPGQPLGAPADPGQAPPWGTGAPPPGPPGRRGAAARLWPRLAAGLGVVLVLCLAGVVKAGLSGWLDSDGEPTAYPTASPPGGVSATSTATAAASGPFSGTPAERYPAGVAGITLPRAAASGPFSAKQAGEALAAVKKALIAGRLDERMLVRRDPDAFLKILAPEMTTVLRKDFSTDKFSIYATQVATGSTLAEEEPRVKGRITYRATTVEGIRVVEVTTNFVWVYPFVVDGSASPDGLVIVHDELRWQFPHPSDVDRGFRGLWLDSGESYASNIDCDQYRKGFIGPGEPEVSVGGDTEDPDSMFDPERSLSIKSNC